jgi:hypothetical protein
MGKRFSPLKVPTKSVRPVTSRTSTQLGSLVQSLRVLAAAGEEAGVEDGAGARLEVELVVELLLGPGREDASQTVASPPATTRAASGATNVQRL